MLPANLSDLDDSLLGIIVPVDPETGGPYEYRVTNDLSLTFELCATFTAESTNDQRAIPQIYPPKSRDYNWQHGAGFTCFERTIDSDYHILEKERNKVPAIPIPNN